MERPNSHASRKISVASREGHLGKVTVAIRALEMSGARTYDSKTWNQWARMAVLLVVMLGTGRASSAKPIQKATEKEPVTTAAVQQGPDTESREDLFTPRERVAIALVTITVVTLGYSLWRYQQICRELTQVSTEADLTRQRIAKLQNECDDKARQLASKHEENGRLRSENAQLRSERDHWFRAANEARALAAEKQYSVEELRMVLGGYLDKNS